MLTAAEDELLALELEDEVSTCLTLSFLFDESMPTADEDELLPLELEDESLLPLSE